MVKFQLLSWIVGEGEVVAFVSCIMQILLQESWENELLLHHDHPELIFQSYSFDRYSVQDQYFGGSFDRLECFTGRIFLTHQMGGCVDRIC